MTHCQAAKQDNLESALVLRRPGKAEEPFARRPSSHRVAHVGQHAGVRLAPIRRLAADDEMLGQYWAPLPGNPDLRTFSRLTPFVIVERAAIHVVAAITHLAAGPLGVVVVALCVIVLSCCFRGEQQDKDHDQSRHADVTLMRRLRFAVAYRRNADSEVRTPTFRHDAERNVGFQADRPGGVADASGSDA